MPGMRAAVNTRYGGPEVVRIRQMPMPAPGSTDVLVRVYASTVSRTDAEMLRAHPFFSRALTGLRRPKHPIRGMDFAGEVAAVGADVSAFGPGDRVFGLAPNDSGGHAEYLCVPAGGSIAVLPPGIGYTDAVVGEGALYANTYLDAIRLRPGQSILIYGASGAIGTAAVQLAKAAGATVTAVVATRHLDLARALGADDVIDYTTADFTRVGRTFDFVLDAVGKVSYFRCRPLLGPRGVFGSADLGPWASHVFLAGWGALTGRRRCIFPIPRSSQRFVEFLAARMAAGEVRAVIDRTYPLEAIVEAYRYVNTGQKTGIVVLTLE